MRSTENKTKGAIPHDSVAALNSARNPLMVIDRAAIDSHPLGIPSGPDAACLVGNISAMARNFNEAFHHYFLIGSIKWPLVTRLLGEGALYNREKNSALWSP
jgi:hypothetical protein